MTTQVNPPELARVACEVCLREVPKSEAIVPEASDYVAYFCGLECYQQWRRLADAAKAEPGPPDQAGTAAKQR